MSQSQERVVASYKVLVGMEIHVQLATETKMFTARRQRRDELRRRAQLAGRRSSARAARHAAGDEQEGGRVFDHGRPGAGLQDRAAHQVGPQELLLPRPAQELPDQPVRPAAVLRRHVRDRRRGRHARRRSASAGRTWKRTPASCCTKRPADTRSTTASSTSTAPARRCSRSSPSRISPRPKQVAPFGQELQKLVQFLGVSEGQMQMGHMRFEPNINVHITDRRRQRPQDRDHRDQEPQQLQRAGARDGVRDPAADPRSGSRPARSARRAPTAGTKRRETTFHQRDKEEAHDYRYFPDPDLVPVEVSDAWLAELKSQVGELPAARRKRYVEALGLSPTDAAILAGDRATGDFFERHRWPAAPSRSARRQPDALARPAARERARAPLATAGHPARARRRDREADRRATRSRPAGGRQKMLDALMDDDAPAEQVATDWA